LADEALRTQVARALAAELCIAPLRLRLGNAGLRTQQAGLRIAIVDARDHLPGLDAVARLDGQGHDVAGDLRRQRRLAHRLHRAVEHQRASGAAGLRQQRRHRRRGGIRGGRQPQRADDGPMPHRAAGAAGGRRRRCDVDTHAGILAYTRYRIQPTSLRLGPARRTTPRGRAPRTEGRSAAAVVYAAHGPRSPPGLVLPNDARCSVIVRLPCR